MHGSADEIDWNDWLGLILCQYMSFANTRRAIGSHYMQHLKDRVNRKKYVSKGKTDLSKDIY